MILFFLYKWLDLCAWTSKEFFLCCPVLPEYVLVLTILGSFSNGAWMVCSFNIDVRFFLILRKSCIMDFCICFVLLLLFSSSNINCTYVGSSFPVFCILFLSNPFFFLFFFLLLCQLYFPNSVSDNGGLGYFRTMWRYLKNPHSGSEDLWGFYPENKGIPEPGTWHCFQPWDICLYENSSWKDENLSKTFDSFKGLEGNWSS